MPRLTVVSCTSTKAVVDSWCHLVNELGDGASFRELRKKVATTFNFKSPSDSDVQSIAPSIRVIPDPDPPSPPESYPTVTVSKRAEFETPKNWEEHLRKRPLILDYRDVDFEHFKNRYGENDGKHMIEVLRAGPTTEDDIQAEIRRRGPKSAGATNKQPYISGDGTWMQRIRINSVSVLAHLRNVAEDAPTLRYKDCPMTFFRPFQMLIDFQLKMREALQDLEARFNDHLVYPNHYPQAASMVGGEPVPPWNPDEVAGPSEMHSHTALAHMRCYINFVDKKLLPLQNQHQGALYTRVRFHDLKLLFKPGDLIFSPMSSRQQNRTAWRVYHARVKAVDDKQPDDITPRSGVKFKLCCYCIDYDGTSYGTVKQKFVIPSFHGEVNITDLPVHPHRYAKNADTRLRELKLQGETFCSTLKEKHLYYDGWTIAAPATNLEQRFAASDTPEHVESAVIVDMEEAFNHCPHLKPKFKSMIETRPQYKYITSADKFYINHWLDRTRKKLLGSTVETLQLNDPREHARKVAYLQNDDLFVMEANKGVNTTVERDGDLVLLPAQLIAYALRERRFVRVDMTRLKPIEKQQQLLEDLKMNMNHKFILKSLVKAHFQSRNIQRHRPEIIHQDLVQGKGAGLVILLHGAPGVGKTATAEAIAQSNNKPSLSITCGDLGSTPSEVEMELKEVFRLAHLWDCVLLLDEADIFLTRRDMTNLKRNALVAVFLRLLEYYSGILFLTTNRVGTLDEAFKSRIHISLYYERLDLERTMAIFEMNIKRLEEIENAKASLLRGSELIEPPLRVDAESIKGFAEKHYYSPPEASRWNGRQIRNAFQIASSLARYGIRRRVTNNNYYGNGHFRNESDSRDGGMARDPLILDATAFTMVADAVERFDSYFHLATGRNDMDAARMDGIREDGVRNEELLARVRQQQRMHRPVRNQFPPEGFTAPLAAEKDGFGFGNQSAAQKMYGGGTGEENYPLMAAWPNGSPPFPPLRTGKGRENGRSSLDIPTPDSGNFPLPQQFSQIQPQNPGLARNVAVSTGASKVYRQYDLEQDNEGFNGEDGNWNKNLEGDSL